MKLNLYCYFNESKGNDAADGRPVMGGDYDGRNDGLGQLMLPYDGLRWSGEEKPLQFYLSSYMLFSLFSYLNISVKNASLGSLAFKGQMQRNLDNFSFVEKPL